MKARELKAKKREEAAVRQAEYDALSIEDKITRVKSRPGNSTKELKRLSCRCEQQS